MRKQKKMLARRRLEELSETNLDVELIKAVQSNVKMWEQFDEIVTSITSTMSTTERKLKFAMTAVLLSVLFGSWQRPGAVVNLKLHQFHNALKVDDVYVASVLDHKTGIGGAAKLMFDAKLYGRMNEYLKYIRPAIVSYENKEVDNVFLMPDGSKVKNVNNLIRFMQNEINIDIPTATQVRKIGATAVARKCTEDEARIVAKQMAHDSRVSAKYYQAVRGAGDAKQAFDTMSKVLETEEPLSRLSWDLEEIMTMFSDYIDNYKTPSLNVCHDLMPQVDSKKLQDKVRTN